MTPEPVSAVSWLEPGARGDAAALLHALCRVHPDRRPGSPGNDEAVDLVAGVLSALGWRVECPRFPVVDWSGEPGTLTLGEEAWPVHPSPYGLGYAGQAPLHPVADEAALAARHDGAILLLHGDLTAAPLTPKDYPFYGSDRDSRIVARLEQCGALAVVAVTGRAPQLAGSWDPFPLIEDGAFEVPTANMTAAAGASLLASVARHPEPVASLDLPARRWATWARNVVARRGAEPTWVTVVAHLDSKPGTPGAVDNASGVVVLVRVAQLLADADPSLAVELLAVNGEDCYSAAGEQHYLATTDLACVRLALNIDGVGYRGSPTAISAYNWPEGRPVPDLPGVVPGPQWPQSDHMLFAMAGRPALALTSAAADHVLQHVAHSPLDTADLVDLAALESTAQAVATLVRRADWLLRDRPGEP
jgi:aminopeptidase YwaD